MLAADTDILSSAFASKHRNPLSLPRLCLCCQATATERGEEIPCALGRPPPKSRARVKTPNVMLVCRDINLHAPSFCVWLPAMAAPANYCMYYDQTLILWEASPANRASGSFPARKAKVFRKSLRHRRAPVISDAAGSKPTGQSVDRATFTWWPRIMKSRCHCVHQPADQLTRPHTTRPKHRMSSALCRDRAPRLGRNIKLGLRSRQIAVSLPMPSYQIRR